MDRAQPISQGTTAAAALEALQKRKGEEEAKNVIAGNDLTSLNKLLQWGAANSVNPDGDAAESSNPKSNQDLAKDREWLDAAFPDMFAEVKKLVDVLQTEDLADAEKVEVLMGLEEYFVDMNYAVNIEKLGALQPVLQCTESENAPVRAAAIWVLGSALQCVQEVKDLFMKRDGHIVLSRCLMDDDAKVRAKAIMASSALLRHSPQDIQEKFRLAGGEASLRRLLSDAHTQVRRRARFFLQFAPGTGNESFVRNLLADRNAIALLSDSIANVDVDDVDDVEAAVGAMKVLVDMDRQGLLQVAPELPGVIDELVTKCMDPDSSDSLKDLATLLG